MWQHITSVILQLCSKQRVWFNKCFDAFRHEYISDFLKHLLGNQHSVDSIDNTMEFQYATGKGSDRNMVE